MLAGGRKELKKNFGEAVLCSPFNGAAKAVKTVQDMFLLKHLLAGEEQGAVFLPRNTARNKFPHAQTRQASALEYPKETAASALCPYQMLVHVSQPRGCSRMLEKNSHRVCKG